MKVRPATAAAAVAVAEAGAVVARQVRTRPLRPSKPRKTTPLRLVTLPRSPVRARVDAVVGVAGGVRKRLPPRTTRRTPSFEFASPAVKMAIARFPVLTDRPGWRPSDSGGAKGGRQVGVVRRS